jgi:integrase
MSVRKRTWKTAKGEEKTAWIVDYVDGLGTRRLKTFERKKDADAYSATARVDISKGVHTADSVSITVAEAGKRWIEACERVGLERTTVESYRQHLDDHIVPFIGRLKLSQFTVPAAVDFETKLSTGMEGQEPRSPAMVKRVLGDLGSLIAVAQEQGLASNNPVRDMRGRRKRGKDSKSRGRHKERVHAGKDFPTPQEIRAIVGALQGRWRPILLTAIFTGLRASELRGLTWADVDLKTGEIHVRRRADRYCNLGSPKSKAGRRVVPLSPIVANTLRELKLAGHRTELGLVFPTTAGKPHSLQNIVARGLIPAQIKAGVTGPVLNDSGTPETGKDDKPVLTAKYPGMHALRHFYASWCINRQKDGGLELPPKMVQERLGHSSITMTMDVYGHLFKSDDHGAELAAAEKALIG